MQLSPAQLQHEGLQMQLPQPRVVVGTVYGEKGAGESLSGVSDITVEAYRRIDDKTVILGEARTDANGQFRMVISSEL
jgi:hypothetical protein